MLRFVLHKLFNKKWLAICLLIGNVLLVAAVVSSPLYTDAAVQRTLTKTMSQSLVQDNVYPARITVVSYLGESFISDTNRQLFDEVEESVKKIPELSGVPAQTQVEEYKVQVKTARVKREGENGRVRAFHMTAMGGFEQHSRIVTGRAPAQTMVDGVIEAVVSEQALIEKNILVGDELTMGTMIQEDGTPFRVQIVGVYEPLQEEELYWEYYFSGGRDPGLIIAESVYKEYFYGDRTFPYGVTYRCSIYFDYKTIRTEQVEPLYELVEEASKKQVTTMGSSFSDTIRSSFDQFLPQKTALENTIFILQVPVFVLLAAYLFMVSMQLMDLEANEITVIKSRGSTKAQIIILYFIQALLISAVGLLLGYPLSFFCCQLLGASNSFLEFVQRSSLQLRITGSSLGYAMGAGAAACFVMTLPALQYVSVSIVQHKVRRQNYRKKPWWQRAFCDIIMLAIALYGYYAFSGRQGELAEAAATGQAMDPLLYFSSSLFMVGAGLLAIRLLPLAVKGIFWLGKRIWPPALYTAFLRVLRTKNNQTFIMLFLILTISLGIFNTSSARAINKNTEDHIVYFNGADLILREEGDYEKYFELEEAESVTRISYAENARISVGSQEQGVLMGIHTREFGETSNFDADLMEEHWYNLLNALSENPEGVLVSSNFREELGLDIGSPVETAVTFQVYNEKEARYEEVTRTVTGQICGFFDYWPTYATTVLRQSGEEIKRVSNYMVVANIAHVENALGEEVEETYQIWIDMKDSTMPIYEFANEKQIVFSEFHDTAADLVEAKNGLVLQGTNGMMTFNFIIVLALCAVGFLIYWILSIRSRELQFGIFRAMGMSVKEILVMLMGEQVLISGASILIGVGIGTIATRLYLPLLSVAYQVENQTIPLKMVMQTEDSLRLFVVIAAMIIVCMVILGWLISRIRIAQALKLGED